jgi:hypothetical protein
MPDFGRLLGRGRSLAAQSRPADPAPQPGEHFGPDAERARCLLKSLGSGLRVAILDKKRAAKTWWSSEMSGAL